MLHVPALTLGAAWMFVAMFRGRLDAIKHMVTVAATIFVGRHWALHSDSEPKASSSWPQSVGNR